MAKEGSGRLLGEGQGEISDSASLEEINEADFRKQEAKGAASFGEGEGPEVEKARVWTMQDLYKYQVKRGYASGLQNLAWAQAVKNKPLHEVPDMEIDKDGDEKTGDGSSVNGATKVVIDESSDEVLENEEGEIEEGEFGMEVNSGSKGKEEESLKYAKLEDVDDFYESEIDVDDDEIGRRLLSFQEALDSVISFEEVCYRLHNCLENLRKVVLGKDLPTKVGLVELFFSAVQSVYSELCSLTEGQKDWDKEIFVRFLSLVKGNRPSFLSAEQAIEVENMMRALNPASVGNAATAKLVPIDSLAVQSADVNQRTIAAEGLRNALARGRGMLLPLLDLHKDHDEDSLPSPTQRAPSSLAFPRATVMDRAFKQGINVSKSGPEPEEERVHPYENDALKAVSSYQQKFGRSSPFSYDDLPSPTPSEEHDNQGGDTGGEVSSSATAMFKFPSAPVLGRPSPPLAPNNDKPSAQGISAAPISTPVTSAPTQLVKSSLKSRDPRLRFASRDSGTTDLNQRQMSVTRTAPKAEPVGVIVASTKECNFEALVVISARTVT